MNTLLSIRNLQKSYQKRPVINSLNWEIEEGKIYGLIGQNGVGKTTLLRLIAGLAIPDCGDIKFHKLPPAKGNCRIGGIIETPAFYSDFSGRQNLEYYCILYGIQKKTKVTALLKKVGLQDDNKKYKNYSLGMKQRLAVALALLNDPDLIILDEPNNGLDPLGIAQLRGIITALSRQQGVTFLISSHVLTELSQIVDKVSVMDHGTIVRQFDIAELNEKSTKVLLLKVNDYHKAQQIICQINPEITCSYRDNQGLRCENFGDVQKILAELINAGVQISAVHEEHENLENLFLSTIGRQP